MKGRTIQGVWLFSTLGAGALAATSIAALLAELYGVAHMDTVVRYVTLPGLALLASAALVPVPSLADVQRRIRVGAVGGLVGLVGYDLVRVPLVLAGQQVFAPVASYGLMATGASMSSRWTAFAGWAFHMSNGVTFGVVYALVAARRRAIWGVAWGVALETAALFSPFRELYGLNGKWGAIALALVAHVAYGAPLGLVVQRLDAIAEGLRRWSPAPTSVLLGLAIGVILVWQRPWSTSSVERDAGHLAARSGLPTALVRGNRFQPEWLLVDAGGCVDVVNQSGLVFRSKLGPLPDGTSVKWCFTRPGIERLKLSNEPFSGGFVYVRDATR